MAAEPRPGTSEAAPAGGNPVSAAPEASPAAAAIAAGALVPAPSTYISLLAQLEEALAQAEAEVEDDRRLERIAFVPNTPEKVAWLMRLLFELQEQGARILATAEARLRAIEASQKRLGAHYAAPLLDHLRIQLLYARGGSKERKSVRLEEGVLGRRKVKGTGGVQLVDVDAAAAHAEATDDPIAPRLGAWVTRYDLDRARYLARAAALFDQAGELLPGCSFVPEAEILYVKSDLPGMKQIPLARVSVGGQIAARAPQEEE